jgi:hypothetical protein
MATRKKTVSKKKPKAFHYSSKKPLVTKKQTKEMVVTTVAVSAVGILGYFGWQYLQKKKKAKNAANADNVLAPTVDNSLIVDDNYSNSDISFPTFPKIKKAATTSTKSVFPLKKGSKGVEVTQLQNALMNKYGKTVLPKYGADGDFGSETVNALKKIGLATTVSESMFSVLTENVVAASTGVGTTLYKAVVDKNYNAVMSALKNLNNVSDYTAANEVFKNERIKGVHQTIVNGILSTFTSTKQKEAIKLEFLRMGLQFDGKKWSIGLSGFDGKTLVTTLPTTVWINANKGVQVPARMVLGSEISRRLDYILFENNGKYFLVNTNTVQYL